MPGAWELRNSVLCCILHTDVTTVAWALALRNLQGLTGIMPLSGMPYDHARNAACMKAIEMGVAHVFFLDSDVAPPHDTVPRLMAHKKPLISGVYCRRSPPHAVPVMIKNGTWVTKYPKNSVIEVDVVGAGCLLISTELLKKMPAQRPQAGKHWFDWRVDMAGLVPPGENLSEDFTMCVHAKRTLGVPTLVDTSIQCRHIGHAEATDGQFVPLNTIPVT